MTEVSGQVSTGLAKVISAHGHAFQYAVISQAERLSEQSRMPWRFEVAEFPVVAGGRPTHIDFVLRSRSRATMIVASSIITTTTRVGSIERNLYGGSSL